MSEVTDKPKRTQRQNRALHKLFTLIAETFNDAGYDMKKTLKESVEISWTPESVKEYLWRPVQKAMLSKNSTTELTTAEIDEVFDVLNKHFGEKFGLHVPFPSVEEILHKQRGEEDAGRR